MATITDAQLSLAHDHRKKTVNAVVKCKVKFTALELCQMKTCSGSKLFKLKCQLWGEDSGLTGADDFLFTYPTVFFFPDATQVQQKLGHLKSFWEKVFWMKIGERMRSMGSSSS
jgi:hypothetical protein